MAVQCVCGEDITGKEAVAGNSCSKECNSLRMEAYRMSKGSIQKKNETAIDTLSNTLAYSVITKWFLNDRDIMRFYVRWKKNIPAEGEEVKVRKAVQKAVDKLVSDIQRSFK